MSLKPAKLAVNLVTHNAEKYLPFCLNSLSEQSRQDFSLLIIDNGSNDETVRYLKENYPQIKLVVHPQNIGFARAHNQGIAWSNSQYLMLLNQDVILDKNYFAKAIDYLDSHPDVAALTGKILVWDFENNQRTSTIDSLGLKVYKNHQVADAHQGEKDAGQFAEVKEIFGPSGAMPIYRRSLLEKVKIDFQAAMRHQEYFDEDFFSYKEDVDLAFRMRLADLKSVYFPGCAAYHDRSVKGPINYSSRAIKKSRQDRDRAVKMYSYKNHLLLLLKNEFFVNLLRYFFPIFWYEFKKIAFILLFEPSTFRGLSLFFKQKSKILKKRRYIKKNICKIKAKQLAIWYQ
ncbi:glycosyltransferase family 2 protein [Patescibacteria group bacterium]|nr:glycosyltransferase family 2 protein [Patescibacteria group bacterium]